MRRSVSRRGFWQPFLAAFFLLAAGALPAHAQNVEDLLAAVVRIKTFVPGDARTAETLGRERVGSGIIIDQNGLVLTIGYLMVEAQGAEVTLQGGRTIGAQIVGYDHDSGFGLLRTIEPIKLKPIALGKSADLKERDPVLIASHGGGESASPAFVVSRREFAGSWEYLLDSAIFTAPPHPAWSGAALLNREGRLVGVGSLIIGDATGTNVHFPGNMFVPIDRLSPVLADLITDGRPSGPVKPWLGLNTEELRGRLFVTRVSPESPAARAGLQPGDVVLGVGGQTVSGLSDFYRKMWARGPAGTAIPLDILQGSQPREVTVQSTDRASHLKLKRTF